MADADYLLDVNVLINLAYVDDPFHEAVRTWVKARSGRARLHTCPIVELGFVRVNLARGGGRLPPSELIRQLAVLKEAFSMRCIADSGPVDGFPAFVRGHRQVTDGYLLQLAERHGMRLLTLDARIPGAELIPDVSTGARPARGRRRSSSPRRN